MDNFYVACDLGAETGRVMLGTLRKGKLTVSEVRRFENQPIEEKDSIQWNIPHVYQELMSALREISRYDEPVDSISCDSCGTDYLLFEPDGSLITPTYHYRDPRNATGMKEVCSRVSWETIYEETGIQRTSANTLFQLGAEKSRRLKRASQLMPVADGFNFLLAGVPRIELSLASSTQLYNPITRAWSAELLKALRLPPELFPPVVSAGTTLGRMRPELVKETGLEDPQIVTSCSHESAAALAGLPSYTGENWAYLRLGIDATMGTQLVGPIISEASRELNYTNEIGFGGTVRFSKQTTGFWILDECKRYWQETDRGLDDDLLQHLAIAAEPFISLVNLSDARFQTPGEMPLKIQAFCKETNQPVPRKPGPIARCVLESMALLYRKTLQEIESITGREMSRLYVLDNPGSGLLNHFIANALQIPLTIAPASATSIGNVVVQALALGHIKSIEEAREIVRISFKTETIIPHATAWDDAYNRLTSLAPA